MKLYNSYSQTIEELKPIEEGKISMYVCGPTVYNYPHIGNARPIVVFDTLKKALSAQGYEVTFASNYTDVDDKIIKTAIEQNVSEKEITDKFIAAYNDVRRGLHADLPDYAPRVTETMDRIIEFIDKMVKNGSAYQVGGDVYFRVNSDKKYGELSHQSIDDLMVGARIDENEKKENPLDFTLWKETTEGIKWDSPWSKGRPGWHTECVVMINDIFENGRIDIHGGGQDLKFPHHENEIAQSKGLTGKVPAKTWMHVEFLQVDGGKMSKSLGNTYTLDQLQEKGIEPLAYKLFCFTAHYRTKLNFTFDTALATQKALMRLREGFVKHQEGTENIDEQEIKEYENKFLETINDDLNMPAAMGIVWEIVRNEHKSKQFAELLLKFDKVLGLDLENSKKYLEESKNVELPQEIQELLEKRKQARADKNWALSDEIRDNLKEKGYAVKDTKDGMTVEKI